MLARIFINLKGIKKFLNKSETNKKTLWQKYQV